MNTRLRQMFSRGTMGWLLYAIAALAWFVLLTFPYEQLQARLLNEVSDRTGLEIRAQGWALDWPLGISWTGVSVTAPGLSPMEADQVVLRAGLWPLLQGQMLFDGQIRLSGRQGNAGGLITSQLSLETWSVEGPGRLTGSVEQLNLSGLPLPLVTQGTLRGTFEQRWKKLAGLSEFLHGQGTWQVEVSGLELEQVPIGPLFLPSVTLASLKTRLQCQSGTCKIEGLQGDGPDGTLHGNGILTLRARLSDSRLILPLSLTVTEAFKRRAPVAALLPGLPGAPVIVTLSGSLSHLQPAL
jgi:type II secretion system protein N